MTCWKRNLFTRAFLPGPMRRLALSEAAVLTVANTLFLAKAPVEPVPDKIWLTLTSAMRAGSGPGPYNPLCPKRPTHTDETPETFRPYGVGYIELACGLKVESRLRENKADQLEIGMPMRLEIITVRKDDEGAELLTFQFCAAEEQD